MDMISAMAPGASSEQSDYSTEMGTHGELMAQILMGLGRLEAKVDMLMQEDAAEKEAEPSSATPQLSLPFC